MTPPVLPVSDSAAAAQEFYAEYYARKGADRNNLLCDPGVLYQVLAQDCAMINTLRSANIDPHLARVLDVGCGDGGSLWLLVRLGFPANNLVGVDIQQDRILKARARQTEITFECGDATKLRFADCSFHLVMESTMFIHATDDVVATAIADEMIRVTKPGGTLLISDWRYAKPHNPHYKAVTAKRIKELFKVGVRTELLKRSPGALLPPVGRFLSKRCSWSYFAVQKIFPFITGHMVTLIRKV